MAKRAKPNFILCVGGMEWWICRISIEEEAGSGLLCSCLQQRGKIGWRTDDDVVLDLRQKNGNGSKEKGSEPTGEERATLALWYCTNLLIVVESKAAACDTKASQSYLVLFFIFPSM